MIDAMHSQKQSCSVVRLQEDRAVVLVCGGRYFKKQDTLLSLIAFTFIEGWMLSALRFELDFIVEVKPNQS
jgi:hypothetical protein